MKLPRPDGTLEEYTPGTVIPWPERAKPPQSRIAFAAAHVVADPLATVDPSLDSAIDWDSTLAFRHRLWDLGLSVAEAAVRKARARSSTWLTCFRLADQASLLRDPELAMGRMKLVLALAGL